MANDQRGRRVAPNEDYNLESWNPMLHDYENRDFNRYSQGVGRDLTGSARGRGVRLYADGVPMELGQDGFYNLFAEYGNVLDSNLRPGRETQTSGYGFVTLETSVEAEQAIRALHKKNIGTHVLKVRPAFTDEEKERRKGMRQAETDFMQQKQQSNFLPQGYNNPAGRRPPILPDYHHQRYPMPGKVGLMGSGPGMPAGTGVLGPRPMRGMGFLGPRPGIYHSFNPGPRPFGQPGMGMGRGQGILPAPKSGHIDEKKTCLNCRKDGSSFRCEACKSYYCSVTCQQKHWPQHKPVCLEIRKYLEENKPLRYTQGPKKPEAVNDTTSSIISKFKENIDPKQDDGYESDKRKFARNTDSKKGKPIEKPAANTKPPPKTEAISKKASQELTVETTCKNNPSSDQGTVGNTSQSGAGDACTSIEELTLDVGKSGKCLLTHYESPNKFWVSLEENMQHDISFAEIMHATTEVQKQTVENLKAGDNVAAKCGEEWCRARVLAVKGSNITIFFVDVGKQESVHLQDLKPYDEDLLTFKTQVVCCCISQVKPLGSGSWSEAANSFVKEWFGEPNTKMIDFTMMKRKGSTHALDLIIENESLKEALISRRLAEAIEEEPGLPSTVAMRQAVIKRVMVKDMASIAEDCDFGSELCCVQGALDSPHKLCMLPVLEAVVQYQKELAEQLLKTPKKNEAYKPIVGELVIAKYSVDELWYRAEVEAENAGEYLLLFVDYGNKESATADNIRQMTDKFLIERPILSLSCALHGVTIPPNLDNAVVLETLQLKVMEYTSDGMLKMLVKDKNLHNIFVDFVTDKNSESLCQAFQNKMNSLGNSVTSVPKKAAQSPTLSKSPAESRQESTGPTNQPERFSHAPNRTQVSSERIPIIKSEKIPEAGSGKVKAVVTFFKSCQEFYVRLCSGDMEYVSLFKKLNSFIASKPAVKSPAAGLIVAALFLIDNNWYRAKILSVDGENVTVLFLDFGNEETVQSCHLRLLPQSMMSLPVQAIHCSFPVVQVIPKGTLKQFKQFIEEQMVFVEQVVGDSKEVPLVNLSKLDGTDIFQLLKDVIEQQTQRAAHQVKPETTEESPQVQGIQKIPQLPITKNTPIPATCVYAVSPLEMYIQPDSCTKDAGALTLRITERLLKDPCPVTSVAVGDLVASRFSQDTDDAVIWYRCKVLSIHDNSCLIHFIDYGNRENQDVKNLMMLVAADYKDPAYTLQCRLQGCTHENAITDNGEEMSQMEKVIIREQSEDIYIVDILDSEEMSITEKFIRKSSVKSPVSKLKDLQASPKKQSEEVLPGSAFTYETLSENADGHLVMVSTVKSCSETYVVKHSESLPTLMVELREIGDSLPCLTNPSVGSICVAKFSEDQDWYRAVVEDICSTETCRVKFVDYGNSEETSLSDLKQLTDDMKKIPAQAIKCCFEGHDCNNPLDVELTQALTSEVLKVHIVKHRDGVPVIIPFIVDGENQDPLNITCCVPKHEQEQVTPAPSPVPRFVDLVHWVPSTTFDAIITDYHSIADFSCIPKEYFCSVMTLSSQLDEACSNESKSGSVIPIVDGVYACKFEGSWYRCRVHEVKGDIVLLNYFDWGNCEERNSQDLVMLLPEHLELPVYLLRCGIFGVEPSQGQTWTSDDFAEVNDLIKQIGGAVCDADDCLKVTICGEDSDRKLVNLSSKGEDVASILIDMELVQMAQIKPQVDNETVKDEMPLRQDAAPPVIEKADDIDDEADDQAAILDRQIAALLAEREQLRLKKGGKK